MSTECFERAFQDSLLNVNVSEVDYLLGIFNDNHINYNLEATDQEPNLSDMSLVAMNMLSRNKDGYLLLIEGICHSERIFRFGCQKRKS